MYRPSKIFFTKGVGRSKEYLTSFELALRSAGIEMCNLVSVSSIFPVNCRRVTKEEGLKEIEPGQIVHILAEGANYFLAKPAPLQDLVAAIQGAVR